MQDLVLLVKVIAWWNLGNTVMGMAMLPQESLLKTIPSVVCIKSMALGHVILSNGGAPDE